MLPLAAVQGMRRLSGNTTSVVPYHEQHGQVSEEHLIPEGARRGDFLQFFSSGKSFSSDYSVGLRIGQGGFGKVFEATHNVLHISRAVKRIKKSQAQVELRKNELSALLALDHPHIIKLVGYYDEDSFLYLVFERCHGPDLLQRIKDAPEQRLSEYDASVALRHMLKALHCCHAQYRGHYDIKPENFMYANRDCKDLMMIDLGMSSGFDNQQRDRIKGTIAYMAPEFWHGIYGPEGDIWCCGVVLFVMLTGELLMPDVPPGDLKRELQCRDILKERLRVAAQTYRLSPEAQDLLNTTLSLDRHGRPTVREALRHQFNLASYDTERWLPQSCENPAFRDAIAVRERLADIFRAVAREPMLKRLARMAMAHSVDVSVQDLAAERLVFRMLDQHGYGELSISVLEHDYNFRKSKVPEDLDNLFEAMDLNRDGYISYAAFLAIMLPESLCGNRNLLKVAFDILDSTRDGYIDADDLAACFEHKGGPDLCQNIMADVCPEDGRMCELRFIEMMAPAYSAAAGDAVGRPDSAASPYQFEFGRSRSRAQTRTPTLVSQFSQFS